MPPYYGLPRFPTNCSGHNYLTNRTFCSIVYFNECDSYKSLIRNGLNYYMPTEPLNYDGVMDLPL